MIGAMAAQTEPTNSQGNGQIPNDRGSRGRFLKGNQRGVKGKPKGTLNKITKTGLEFAQELLDDPLYRRNLKARMRRGAAPHMDNYVWNRLVGKPKETMAFEGKPPFILQMLSNKDPLAKEPDDDEPK